MRNIDGCVKMQPMKKTRTIDDIRNKNISSGSDESGLNYLRGNSNYKGHFKEKNEIRNELFLGIFKLGNLLGEGTYGKVKYAQNMKENRPVALKIIDKKKIKKSTHLKRVLREVRIMSLINNPYLCKFYQGYETEDSFILEMEYVEGKELFKYITDKKWLPESKARFIFYQLLEGVSYLHQHKIIHRDIKPENIIINKRGQIKIVDFGFACTFEYFRFCGTHCGSPYYAAPEMVSANDYIGPEVDVWSLGIVLYTMVHGVLPFEADCIKNLYTKILECKYIIDKRASPLLANLLKSMIHFDTNSRIQLNEILKHPWINYDIQPIQRVPISTIDSRIITKLIEYKFTKTNLMRNIDNVYSTEWCFYKLIDDKIILGNSLEYIGSIIYIESQKIKQKTPHPPDISTMPIHFQNTMHSLEKDQNLKFNNYGKPPCSSIHYSKYNESPVFIKNDSFLNEEIEYFGQIKYFIIGKGRKYVSLSLKIMFQIFFKNLLKNGHRYFKNNRQLILRNEPSVLIVLQFQSLKQEGFLVEALLLSGSYEIFVREINNILYGL